MIFTGASNVNYIAILAGAVLSMIIGAIWFGPLFGRKWLQIIGADASDIEERKKMQRSAGPLYIVQFLLTLLQVLVLSHLIIRITGVSGFETSIWIWSAFVIPAIAGAAMWTTEKSGIKWARFLIQGGYQLLMFIVYGLLLQFWK